MEKKNCTGIRSGSVSDNTEAQVSESEAEKTDSSLVHCARNEVDRMHNRQFLFVKTLNRSVLTKIVFSLSSVDFLLDGIHVLASVTNADIIYI